MNARGFNQSYRVTRYLPTPDATPAERNWRTNNMQCFYFKNLANTKCFWQPYVRGRLLTSQALLQEVPDAWRHTGVDMF